MGGTQTVLAKDKKCGSCQYWQGNRKIRFVNNSPYSVTVDAEQASCGAKSNKTYGIGTCPKWKKWADL